MNAEKNQDIFLVTVPGLERLLCAEAKEKGFKKPKMTPGGVRFRGRWSEVWRANLELRGASKVLVRLGSFRVTHLSQLENLVHAFPWGEVLRADQAVRVEATCIQSKIYHSGAVVERISKAIEDELGAPVSPDADLTIKVRIVENMCTISVDTSGEGLHKRGHKQAVNRAPLRETLASLFLRECKFDGTEPVLDPMCGSGTFVIEAAEIAADLQPGRSRHFAFERLKTFDEAKWQELRERETAKQVTARFYGSDRDSGAIRMSRENAERAGVSAWTDFQECPVSELVAPDGPPGLVMVNPPYGGRIGNMKQLNALYRSLGQVLSQRFAGWRVGLVTNTPALAKNTRLPFVRESDAIDHGGIRVKVYSTDALPGR